jgi:DIS3-like exonuclease 1
VSVEPNSAKRRPMGRVVGIVQRNWRSYVATIQEDGIEKGGSMHLAIPLHPVIPKIRIRHQDVKSIGNQRIVVRIDSW